MQDDGQSSTSGNVPASEQELMAWLDERLRGEPRPMPTEAAVCQLLADLEVAQQAFAQHEQIGAMAAMVAVGHASYALGRPELAVPFRTIANGLNDLRQGKRPRIFRPAPTPRGNPKSTEEWDLLVVLCAYLELLVVDVGMPNEAAARAVAERLRRKAERLRWKEADVERRKAIPWKSLLRRREDIRRGKCPPDVPDRFHQETAALRRDLAVHAGAGGDATELQRKLLNGLDLTLSGRFAFPE